MIGHELHNNATYCDARQRCMCVQASVMSVTSDFPSNKAHVRPIRVNVMLTFNKVKLELLCPW
jgi:hypothetical protein